MMLRNAKRRRTRNSMFLRPITVRDPYNKRRKVVGRRLTSTVAFNRGFRAPVRSWLYNPRYATKINSVFRGYKFRKNFNRNAAIIKSRNTLLTAKTYQQQNVNHKFVLDATYTDQASGTTYKASGDLFVMDKIQTLGKSISHEDHQGRDTKGVVQMTGVSLLLTVSSVSLNPLYVKFLLVRDKWQCMPGLPKPDSTASGGQSYGGVTVDIMKPNKLNTDTYDSYMTGMFTDLTDIENISHFGDVQQNLRCIERINPLRYTVLWKKTLKLDPGGSLKSKNVLGNTNNVRLIKQYIPYYKRLVYQHASSDPSNDKLVLLVFTSFIPLAYKQDPQIPAQKDKDGKVVVGVQPALQCYLNGRVRMNYVSATS